MDRKPSWNMSSGTCKLGRTLSLAGHRGSEVHNKCHQSICPRVLSINQDCQLRVVQKTRVSNWRCKALSLWRQEENDQHAHLSVFRTDGRRLDLKWREMGGPEHAWKRMTME